MGDFVLTPGLRLPGQEQSVSRQFLRHRVYSMVSDLAVSAVLRRYTCCMLRAPFYSLTVSLSLVAPILLQVFVIFSTHEITNGNFHVLPVNF